MNHDPAASLLRAGNDTLLRVAGFSLLIGAAAAVLVAVLIFLGSTCLPPRTPRGQVWAEWRRHVWLWLLFPALGAAGALFASDLGAINLGTHTLLWVSDLLKLRQIAWLGAGSGYSLLLFLMVLTALLARRRR